MHPPHDCVRGSWGGDVQDVNGRSITYPASWLRMVNMTCFAVFISFLYIVRFSFKPSGLTGGFVWVQLPAAPFCS